MRKLSIFFLTVMLVAVLAISADAVDSLKFSQTCKYKTNSSVTMYVWADTMNNGAGGLAESIPLAAGTYIRYLSNDDVCANNPGLAHIICSPNNSDEDLRYGYIKSSAISAAMASVTLQSGNVVKVPEALLKSKSALDYYLDMEYGETSGSEKTYTDENGTEQEIGEEKEYNESSGLTREEWEARMAKAKAANGSTTGTVYTDPEGNVHPADLISLGLGMSTVKVEGEKIQVATSQLSWDTNAPEDKVLAVVSANKQGYATLRSKKSKSAFVMNHCITCSLVRVISYGKTWCLVDYQGLRGYVLTGALSFFSNEAKEYQTGCISFRGKTSGSKNTVHTRAAAKSSARTLGEYAVGTPIAVFDNDGKWCEIDIDGFHCYVLSEFVTVTDGP